MNPEVLLAVVFLVLGCFAFLTVIITLIRSIE